MTQDQQFNIYTFVTLSKLCKSHLNDLECLFKMDKSAVWHFAENMCLFLLKSAPCHLLCDLASAAVCILKRHNFLHNKKWIIMNLKKASPAVT